MVDPRKLIVVSQPVLAAQSTRIKAILALSPFAYWPFDEAASTTISDQTGNGYHGVGSANLTYNHDGPGSGLILIYFDGNECVDVHGAAFNADFTTYCGPQGSMCMCGKADDWVTGNKLFTFLANGNNQVNMNKDNTNDRVVAAYYANAVYKTVAESSGQSTTAWRWYCMTWDINAGVDGEMKFYINNSQIGSTQTALGVFTGNLVTAGAALGATDNVGSGGWLGYLSEQILFDRAISSADRAAIYAV